MSHEHRKPEPAPVPAQVREQLEQTGVRGPAARKDTRRWCKGIEGREHVTEWRAKGGYYTSRELVCTVCGKVLATDYRWTNRLSDKLRELRKEAGLTQETLAVQMRWQRDGQYNISDLNLIQEAENRYSKATAGDYHRLFEKLGYSLSWKVEKIPPR